MSAGHNRLAVWGCAGHQDPNLSVCVWDATCVAVQGLWTRPSFAGCFRDFHHSMGWESPLQAKHPYLFAGETYSPTYILLQTSFLSAILTNCTMQAGVAECGLALPSLFRFCVNYGACLPQCDYIHTFLRFRSVLWKFIKLCFNRFCCNTSVNWHICPFSVRNIVLMLNRV